MSYVVGIRWKHEHVFAPTPFVVVVVSPGKNNLWQIEHYSEINDGIHLGLATTRHLKDKFGANVYSAKNFPLNYSVSGFMCGIMTGEIEEHVL